VITAVASHKGGVGKTTIAVNLAAALVELGRRVLLIDLDPQANASLALGVVLGVDSPDVGDVLLHLRRPREVSRETAAGVDVMPSSTRLISAADKLDRGYYKQEHLAKEIGGVDGYDHVLVDCPPALGVLTANAIFAAQRLVVPFPLDTFAYSGLSDLIALVEAVRREPMPMSLLVSLYDARTKRLNAAILEQIGEQQGMLLESRIPRCEAVRQSQGAQVPVLAFQPDAIASIAFRSLATELLGKQEDQHAA
jgi:chromosome partitioning protein